MRSPEYTTRPPAYVLPLLWSAAFLFVALVPAFADGRPLKSAFLLFGAGVWLCWMRRGQDREKVSTALLLFAFLEDYAFWLFFARYETPQAYIVLAATEALRFACLVLLVRHCTEGTPLKRIFTCFALKLLLDFSIAPRPSSGFGFALHPLYAAAYPERIHANLHLFLQLLLFAFAVATSEVYGKRKPAETLARTDAATGAEHPSEVDAPAPRRSSASRPRRSSPTAGPSGKDAQPAEPPRLLGFLSGLLTNPYFCFLLIAVALILGGARSLLTGEDGFAREGFSVPAMLEVLVLLPAGVIIGLTALRALLRGENGFQPPRVYTDEDLKRVKEELDALYLYDHGRPPEHPKEEEPVAGAPVAAGQRPPGDPSHGHTAGASAGGAIGIGAAVGGAIKPGASGRSLASSRPVRLLGFLSPFGNVGKTCRPELALCALALAARLADCVPALAVFSRPDPDDISLILLWNLPLLIFCCVVLFESRSTSPATSGFSQAWVRKPKARIACRLFLAATVLSFALEQVIPDALTLAAVIVVCVLTAAAFVAGVAAIVEAA